MFVVLYGYGNSKGKSMENYTDVYSIILHENASEKALLDNWLHSRKLYYFNDQVPVFYKE